MKPEDMLEAMEEATKLTAWLTGVKADLVERGWNEHNAERLVITMLAQMGGAAK